MGSTLLQLVQATTTELGLPTPSYVIASPDNTGRQMGALATRLGQMMLRDHDWTDLSTEWHITVPPPVVANGNLTLGSMTIGGLAGATGLLPSMMVVSGTGLMTSTRLLAFDAVAGNATIDQPATATLTGSPVYFRQDTFNVPADFLRPINRTQWDRSMRWELRGPQSPQSDQWVRSGIVATGPRRHFRGLGSQVRIWPAPSATDSPAQLISEYVSNQWVTSAAGTMQAAFQADADSCMFADDLMVEGLKYLFFAAKGFDYSELKLQFMRSFGAAKATDGGAPALDMGRTRIPVLISPANVQDAGYGGAFGNP